MKIDENEIVRTRQNLLNVADALRSAAQEHERALGSDAWPTSIAVQGNRVAYSVRRVIFFTK